MLTDFEQLVDAYVLLAVSYFRRGQDQQGTDVLEQVARLKPDLALDAKQYPPLFLTTFDKARERALSRTRGSIRVTSAPLGAEDLAGRAKAFAERMAG